MVSVYWYAPTPTTVKAEKCWTCWKVNSEGYVYWREPYRDTFLVQDWHYICRDCEDVAKVLYTLQLGVR